MVARRGLARLAAVCVFVAQAALAPVAGAHPDSALASGRHADGRAPSSLLAPEHTGASSAPVPPGSAGVSSAPVPPGSAGILPAVVPPGTAGTSSAPVPPGSAGILPAPVGRSLARGISALHPDGAPASSPRPARRPSPPSLTLSLTTTPAHPVALQTGQLVATLSRPVSDGRVTFTMRQPAAGVVYTCAPVHGRCAMTWSAPRAGAVTVAAGWSGDRHYKAASATLTIAVARPRYSYDGVWQGQRVGPLTRLAPAIDVSRLPDAARAGLLTRFHTDDPDYACLNGQSLAVYTAPRAYPGDDIAYAPAHGTGCAAGTWLFAQGAGVSARRTLSGAAGHDITVQGAFPASRPADAVVQFYQDGQLVATAPVRSWSSHAVTARVPTSLDAGAYTARVNWYDRLTGATVRSGALQVRVSVPRQPSPTPSGEGNPPATSGPDVPIVPGPPVKPIVTARTPQPLTLLVSPTTAANPPPAATATPAPPPATVAPNPPTSAPQPSATSVPIPSATSIPAPAPSSTPNPPVAATSTAVPTDTPTATSTATATATSTPTSSPPATTTPVPSATATATPTSSPSATPTATATSTSTATPTLTATPTATTTPTPSATSTTTPLVPTSTPSLSSTPTATSSPAATSTGTAPPLPSSTATTTSSPTTRPTATATGTAPSSPSGTATASPTGTATATATMAAGCTTTLPSSIITNTELTTSPCGAYISNGTTVQSGATLTVDAGVMVEFNASSGLIVQGALRAVGTAERPITLTGTAASSGLVSWLGVQGEQGATVALGYTTVTDAGSSCGTCAAVYLDGSTATLDHVTVTASRSDGIRVVNGGRLSIRDSTITRVSTAVRVDHATASIYNSVIADNSYGISNCAGCPIVHAENNYWGTTNGPAPYGNGPGISYHQESFYDPNTNTTRYYNVPDVAVEPWLGESTALRQYNGPSGNGGGGSGSSGTGGSSASGGSYAGSANNPTASVAEPVNTASGSYEYSHTDLSLGGRTPLIFARSYNSRTAAISPGPLGYGWSWTYGIALTSAPAVSGTVPASPTVQVTFGTGRTDFFTGQSDGSYAAAPGQFDTLAATLDGGYDVTDKDGTVYHFSSAGALQSMTDHNGNVTSLAYNVAGQLSTVSVAGGRSLTLAYNGDGRIAAVTDNSGRAVTFGYSPTGDLTTVTDPRGHTTTYGYDGGHQLVSGLDRNGRAFVTNSYDAVDSGRVVTQTNALGAVTTFAYYLDASVAPARSVTVVTDPRGAATTYTYDSQLRLTGVRDALGHTTSYSYDAQGDRLSATDPNNHTWTYTYDARGNMLSKTDPLGATTTYTYDARNRPLGVVDPLTHTMTYRYDARENLLARTDALSHTTSYTYDAQGDRLSATDPLTHTTAYGYDAAGDPTTVTDALGHVTATGYDALGRPVTVTGPLGHGATLGYDANGEVITATDALSHTTTTSYDAEGNRLSVTDPRGHTTTYGYDVDNELLAVTDALSHTTGYAYDAAGNRVGVTDALSHTTVTAYDLLGRVTSMTSPLTETVGYGYDAAGNRTSVVNGRGHTITYGYDAGNRLNSIGYADGASVAYSYDTAGRRASMTDSTGMTTYSYDASNRPTSIAQPAGTVTYSYDAAGHRATLGAPGGKTATYGYDVANRLASVTDWRGGVTRYGYDAAGRTGVITYTNGITASVGYDAANHPLTLAYRNQGAIAGSFGYSYDANGNRQTATDANGTTTYGYDALNRLTTAGATSYSYDAVGNRGLLTTSGGSVGYSYNAADELTATVGLAYSYDADGNRVVATNGITATTYSYDDANYLTGVTAGASTATYQYNGDHARAGSAVNGASTSYLLDLAAALPTVLQQSTNGVTTTYLYGNGLLGQDDGASMQTLLPDALGSTRLVADSGGTIVGRQGYDAYGAQSGSGAASAFGFTGQQADAVSGLLYLRARYYDPATGVFLQRDPYPLNPGNSVTIDRYTYANDNPVTLLDPRGMSAVGDALDGYEYGTDTINFINLVKQGRDLSSPEAYARYSAQCDPALVDVCQAEAADHFIKHAILKGELDVVRDALTAIYVHMPSIKGIDEILDLQKIIGLLKVKHVC